MKYHLINKYYIQEDPRIQGCARKVQVCLISIFSSNIKQLAVCPVVHQTVPVHDNPTVMLNQVNH